MGIFDINIHFLYGHPEAIEKTIVLLYESFRLFCARYEQYLTFEVEASHDSNCNFLFNSKQDCIGVRISTICHTIIETCKLAGKSPRRFMERFFHEILRACSRGVYGTINGRTDYQNLLPMTIGGI